VGTEAQGRTTDGVTRAPEVLAVFLILLSDQDLRLFSAPSLCRVSSYPFHPGKRYVAVSLPPSILALRISGDCGGITYYTDRFGRTISFPAAPPKKPASPKQIACRLRFRWSVQAWNELTPLEKKFYEDCTQRLSLCLTGCSLWISLCLQRRLPLWETLKKQSGLPLPRPIRLRHPVVTP